MTIINPNEIGTKISTLIAESNEKFFAITPYIDLSSWSKILINLENAIRRGIQIKFFFREIKDKDYYVLSNLGIELNQIEGLHTKLYLNEEEIIVSSMNLYEYSDLYSIDIALHFTGAKDYNIIYDYFLKYISIKKENRKYLPKSHEDRLKGLHNYLSERFSKSRINATDTYLFSKDLNTVFNIFIEPSEIRLKYPRRNPSKDTINELADNIKKVFGNDGNISFIQNNPTEEYAYCTWKIDLSNQSYLDFTNIIAELQRIKKWD